VSITRCRDILWCCRFTTQSLNYVGDACVEFHYEAYGDTVNTLAVYTQAGVMDWRAARVELWSVRGNQGNVWIRKRIAFRSTDRTLRVCTSHWLWFVNLCILKCTPPAAVFQSITCITCYSCKPNYHLCYQWLRSWFFCWPKNHLGSTGIPKTVRYCGWHRLRKQRVCYPWRLEEYSIISTAGLADRQCNW